MQRHKGVWENQGLICSSELPQIERKKGNRLSEPRRDHRGPEGRTWDLSLLVGRGKAARTERVQWNEGSFTGHLSLYVMVSLTQGIYVSRKPWSGGTALTSQMACVTS